MAGLHSVNWGATQDDGSGWGWVFPEETAIFMTWKITLSVTIFFVKFAKIIIMI